MRGHGARSVDLRLIGHRRGVERLLGELEAAGFSVSEPEWYPVRGNVADVRAYVTIFAGPGGYQGSEQR